MPCSVPSRTDDSQAPKPPDRSGGEAKDAPGEGANDDARVDEAVEASFPASDPPSTGGPGLP